MAAVAVIVIVVVLVPDLSVVSVTKRRLPALVGGMADRTHRQKHVGRRSEEVFLKEMVVVVVADVDVVILLVVVLSVHRVFRHRSGNRLTVTATM